jgi:50S ribosomal subunit-associated GTPase HflX
LLKATLEEAVQADFLVHVIDLGSTERDSTPRLPCRC